MENTRFYTVKELSKELSTSRQTIYNYLDKIDKLKYTKKKGNILKITEQGAELIKELYYKNNPSEAGAEYKTDSNEDIIKTLQKQLEVKDKQIEGLLKTIDNLNDRARETNMLLAQYTIKHQKQEAIEAKEAEEKPLSFIGKIKQLFSRE